MGTAAQTKTALIEARNVTRILPGIVPTTLVHDVNLRISENEFVAITGPSGSGKSSLLYLLGLLDLPTTGEVLIRGKATVHMDEEERALTGSPRSDSSSSSISCCRNPPFSTTSCCRCARSGGCRARPCAPAPAICSPRSAWPTTCTSGRPALRRPAPARGGGARAGQRPPIILADEPTGSLDSKASEQVFEVLRELVDRYGKTVVAVTHDLALAARMDRHVELLDGQIVADEQHRLGVTGRR